ncbi:MAG: glycosyltransferase family 39 protein [Candidatus Omnitrophota bacterium]
MVKNRNIRNILILLVLSYFFFFFGNGIISLTDPDEVFYAGTAKEMIKHQSWMTPYLFDQPQFEKPIFLYWMLRIAFMIFGIGSFAGRFFPAVFAAIGVVAVYLFSLIAFKNEKKAFLSGIIIMSSGLYIGLGRTIFTDMIFSVFILLSLLAFFWGYCRPKRKTTGILLFFVAAGFAVLSKGPLGIFVPLIAIIAFLAFKKDLKFLYSKALLWGLLLFVLISLPWYILMIKKYGNAFTYEFFYNDHIRRLLEAEHKSNDTWHFYPFSMIWAMFPWSAFVAFGLVSLYKNFKKHAEPVYLFLACWVAAVFLVFQPCHSKLVSYIFPMFPALGMIAADFIYRGAAENKKRRLVFFAAKITAAVLILMFIAFTAGSVLFSGYISTYLPEKFPIYILLGLFFIFSSAYLLFTAHHRLLKACAVLMFFVPVLFSVVPFVDKYIEPYISSRDTCRYIQDNYEINNTILTSKFFARGVRYYTEKNVAVMDIPGKGFFSPHPIPFLNNDEKVADFLRKQPVTYCVFKRAAENDVKRLSKEFDYEMLKVIGSEYLYRISPRQKK